MRKLAFVASLVLAAAVSPLYAAEWTDLLAGNTLNAWEVRGEGVWYLLDDGTLVGQRDFDHHSPTTEWPWDHRKFTSWVFTQAWLYTRQEFGQFDLELEYWLPKGGNSGVSIRDKTRAQYAIGKPMDPTKTPSHVAYEIQLNNQYPDNYRSGSIYNFVNAPAGVQHDNQWNRLRIESRTNRITVYLNGTKVAEYAGDPARPKTGPIGLQLHDQFSLAMFRHIRVREVAGP
jgi:3-keto-disaccharide hydrolase